MTDRERFLEHLHAPRARGRLERPDASVQVENPICGDIFRLELRVVAGMIVEVAQVVEGCPAARVLGSVLAGRLEGASLAEARSLTREGLEAPIGGLAPQKRHAGHLALDALRAALAACR
jgi:nitrogen fixation NifU-like protein